MEQLFYSYLRVNRVTVGRVSHELASPSRATLKAVSDDLKRGWYNELAFLVPLKPSTLGLRHTDLELNLESSNERFAFPSWRIAQAYYAVYFYLRALTSIKFGGFRYEEHNATLATFKNSVLEALERSIWYFPLNIGYVPGKRAARKRFLNAQWPHLRFRYCLHPRPPHHSPLELFENVHGFFKRQGKGRSREMRYTIFDFLRDFRIWANYQDIDNLLSLRGSGFRAFLDQGLSLLLFFIGGVSEVAFLAVYGQDEYLGLLEGYYDLLRGSNAALFETFRTTPLCQRMAVYEHLGFLGQGIGLEESPDPNALFLA